MRLRKLARVTGWVVMTLVGLALAGVLLLVVWARSASGRRSLLARVLPDVQSRLDGTLRVGRLEGDLTRTLILSDVELRDADGVVAVRIDRLSVTYELRDLLRRRLVVDDVVVDGAMVHGHSLRAGGFNLAAMIKSSPARSATADRPLEVEIRRARATVEVRYDPPPDKKWMRSIVGSVRLDASAQSVGDRRSLEVASLAARMSEPVVAAADVQGAFVATAAGGELKALHVTGDTDGLEMEKLTPRLAFRGRWHADVTAGGRLAAMAVTAAVTPPTGAIEARGVVGVTGSGVTWRGAATARALDPAALWHGAPHALVAFDGDGDGENARVRVGLRELAAHLAGASVAVRGELTYAHGLLARAVVDARTRDLSQLARLGVRGLGGEAAVHAVVAREAGRSKLDADVDAHRLAAATIHVGRVKAQLHALDWQGSARLVASAIDAGPRLRFDAATVTAELAPRRVALALAAKGPHGSDVSLAAHGARLSKEGPFAVDLAIDRLSLALHGETWAARDGGRFRYDGRGVDGRLTLGAGAQRLALAASYAAGELRAHVVARALDPRRLGRAAALDRELPAGVLDGEATLHGAAARPDVELAVTGALAADPARQLAPTDYRVSGRYRRERIDGTVAVSRLAIERLAPYLPKSLAGLAGVVDGKATLSGTPRKPELDAELDVPRWQWNELDLNQAHLAVRYARERLDATVTSSFGSRARGAAGSVRAELAAPVDLSRGMTKLVDRLVHTTPVTVVLALRGADLARLPIAALDLALPVSAGLVDGDVALHGTLHAPTLDATVAARGLTVAGIDRIDLKLHADYHGGDLRLSLAGDLRGARLLTATAETRLDFHRLIDGERWQDGPLRGDAVIAAYDLSPWKQLHGALTAHAELRGTLAHPEGDLALSVEHFRLGEMVFGRFAGGAHYDARHTSARLDADEERGGGALHASADLAGSGALAAHLRVERLWLSLGNGGLGLVRELRGRLDADVTVAGTPAAPHPSGTLRLSGGAVALSGQAMHYRDLELAISAASDRIRLERLAVKLGNGSLDASGSAQLDGFDVPLGVDLTAQAIRFPFRIGSFAAFVDGKSELHGSRKDGILAIAATVSDGLAQLPRLMSGKKSQSLARHPDITFTDAAARRQRAAEAAEAAEDAPVKASIKAHIPGPFRVRSSELGTDLQGDLDVEVLGEVMRISGTVESTWGRIELLGRRYEIERVRVAFDGAAEPDPALDVEITRAVDAATVIIRVRGTLKRPELELSSEPPIYDQSQIIGIIVSGDPGSTRISDAATDAKVVGAISGVLVNQIKDQIAPGLPIDVIRIDNDAAAAGTSRLEVGKYITERVYLSYTHQFGAPTGIHPVNSNEAQLQYRFKRHYQLETKFGDAGVGAVNFYWSLRY